jgi:hypothetical protein
MAVIRIPVNASNVPESDRTKQRVRVAIKSGKETKSEVVSVASGSATATFELDTNTAVTIAVGPESSDAAELFLRNTPTVTARPTTVDGRLNYHVSPILIMRPIWELWLRWCRTFTISGYVYGQDGNPVPSAQVTASDVDWFWWWSATQQVGTAITGPDGYFEIQFVWCCGWLPWYWWELRDWRLDHVLVEKIDPVLRLNPNLTVSPPSPRLALAFSELNPQPLPPRRSPIQRRSVGSTALSPTTLPALREKLLASLPAVPEFERFCLWPWCPWSPWLDCDPDIIFKVTQNCNGTNQVIVNETVWQARVDIPTHLNVVLTANENACTIPPGDGQPEGDCFLFTAACSVRADQIGLTCDMVLGGLVGPGSSDRPFTGEVVISGQFGTASTADYYGITYRPAQPCPPSGPPVAFQPVPPAALLAFSRTYFDATQPYPNQWFHPVFQPQPKLSGGSTVTVYESRQYYEQVNPPPNWGNVMTGRSWTDNTDVVAVIETSGYFADGDYEFQIVGYTLNDDGSLTANGPLPGCGEPGLGGINNNNDFALYFANPVPSQTNPDAIITSIAFNGTALESCGIQTLAAGEPFSFTVNFTASDAEGFLDSYVLSLQSGQSPPVPLATLIPTAACTPGVWECGAALAPAVAGVLVGPTYAAAIADGATRPNWSGGAMVFTVADARQLFPRNCAYELILTAYKRNIVNCNGDDAYQETAYYSFTVLFE